VSYNTGQNMESTKYVATPVPFKLGVKPRKAESVTTKMEQLVYDLLHASLTHLDTLDIGSLLIEL
jgi:hypothetical protein